LDGGKIKTLTVATMPGGYKTQGQNPSPLGRLGGANIHSGGIFLLLFFCWREKSKERKEI
jgi:hypothetical protein